MKTQTIKTPTAELLIVEAKDANIAWGIVFQKYGARAVADYTLLGKPDEISEEDAKELVETKQYGSHPFFCTLDYRYKGKNKDGFNPGFCADDGYQFRRSLLSLLESEIYWKNPLANDIHAPDIEEWKEAEQKTFDRKRSIIFKKSDI